MHVNSSTFIALKIPVLNFIKSLTSRVFLPYKPLSYKRHVDLKVDFQIKGATVTLNPIGPSSLYIEPVGR